MRTMPPSWFAGLVSSLARPGGNITGVAASAPEGTGASLPLKVLDQIRSDQIRSDQIQ
jgi:hypothetical protein